MIEQATNDDRAFLQRRLRFLVLTALLFTVATSAMALTLAAAYPHARPSHDHITSAMTVASIVLLGAAWIFLRRTTPRPLRSLRVIETSFMAFTGAAIGAGVYIGTDKPGHVFFPFTLGPLLLFARVFIVPGSARWTFAQSLIFIGPFWLGIHLALDRAPDRLGVPMLGLHLGGVFAAFVTVVLASVGSRVIYGLRRDIKAAMLYGQYTLDRKLGEGGMGVVFKARHALLRRPTAIKLLPPEKADAEDIARFEREVQLTSELTHPNTIAIFDYGRSSEGTFYYVMEYLDGVNLETLVARGGALSSARAIPILEQICGALDEAHRRGVVHRDIKPANVVLCRRGRVPDFVKVLDFGLVKEVEQDDKVSHATTISGTPAYMAPEALTAPETVGPAADIYAVGALGYYLVTGKVVFEANTVFGMCAQHINAIPLAPSKRTSNAIDPALEKLLLECLEKAPSSRPVSAGALARRLARLSRQGWTIDDATAWWDAYEASERPPRGIDLADTIAVMVRPTESMEKV